ncbi:MAG: serine protease [Planctomycetaceae bacterium]|nr:serine protease [Planctomycetaceae bacterium]
MTALSPRQGRPRPRNPANLSNHMACRASAFCLALAFAVLVSLPASAAPDPAVIDSVQQRVVKIYGSGGIANLYSYGTGFLVSPEGHIVTVWSHVLDGDVVTVVLNDGRRFYGKLLNAEPKLDLAVVKIDASDLPYFDLQQTPLAAPGTRVLGFSNMFKVAAGDEPVSVVHGVVTAVTQLTARRGRFEVPYSGPVYVVDAVTNNSGAAGGVLTNYDGQLLGMLGRELLHADSNTWINYVMPIGELAPTIDAIRTGDFTALDNPPEETNPLRYSALDFGIVLVPDVIYRTPAYIDSVRPDSQAAAAGLRPDDLVVFLNNQLVPSIRVLEENLGRLQAEDDVQLVVRRGNQLVSVLLRAPRNADASR